MDVIERVKIRGDILIGKVYGYTDSYSDLKEILLSNTFAVVPLASVRAQPEEQPGYSARHRRAGRGLHQSAD